MAFNLDSCIFQLKRATDKITKYNSHNAFLRHILMFRCVFSIFLNYLLSCVEVGDATADVIPKLWRATTKPVLSRRGTFELQSF